MECKDCSYWSKDKHICLDPGDYVDRVDGERCCRYHPNAALPTTETHTGHQAEDAGSTDELERIRKYLIESGYVDTGRLEETSTFELVEYIVRHVTSLRQFFKGNDVYDDDDDEYDDEPVVTPCVDDAVVKEVTLPEDKAALMEKVLDVLKTTDDGVLDLDDLHYDKSPCVTPEEFEEIYDWLARAVQFDRENPHFNRTYGFDEWRIFFNYEGRKFIWRNSSGFGEACQFLDDRKYTDGWPDRKYPMQYEDEYEIKLKRQL